MKEEDFIKVWKDSDRDRILHQYYYDYLEMQRLGNIIDELEKYLIFKKDNAYELENPKKSKLKPYGVEKDMYHISYCRYYEILDKLKELKEEGK